MRNNLADSKYEINPAMSIFVLSLQHISVKV